MPPFRRYPAPLRFVVIMLGLVLLIYVLIAGKLFLYPIALAILFAYLLFPVADFLERHRIPRIIAILLCIIGLITIVSGVMAIIYKRAGVLIGDLPAFRTKALGNIDQLESRLEVVFGISDLQLVEFIRSRVAMLFDAGNSFFNRLFTTTTGTLFRIGIMPVFIFMLLYYRTKYALFILKLVRPDNRMLAISVLREVARVTSRYMGGVFTVVLVLCLVNSTGLLLIGMRHAVVFGILAAVFNFIPYFGTILGYSIPFTFALLTADRPVMALRVLVVFLIVQFLENNILTPNIVGNYVKLNPFIIILGIIAGGMVWGIPGMFIVVPVLAAFRIIFVNIDSLQPYGYLLGTGGTRKHAITSENFRKFMQRFKRRD